MHDKKEIPHPPHDLKHLHGPFGVDKFGVLAEKFARFFGTPVFIIIQTVIVVIWIGLNGLFLVRGFDPFPFILLNLCFSTQAAYAAPLILLAQTRQADRDEAQVQRDDAERIQHALEQQRELDINTAVTNAIHKLTVEIHKSVVSNPTNE